MSHEACRFLLRSPTENHVNGLWIFLMVMGHSHVLCELMAVVKW
uniref:Uncharacterized protein n=1 Tax=Arundo donax TaxID=35708 RepID=A0A0A8YIU4_ARUDO